MAVRTLSDLIRQFSCKARQKTSLSLYLGFLYLCAHERSREEWKSSLRVVLAYFMKYFSFRLRIEKNYFDGSDDEFDIVDRII